MESTVGIALLGRGTVGGGVAELLRTRRAQIERRTGAAFTLHGIADRSHDPIALVEDPRVDIVIECIGGTDVALECMERALERRKHVVTANKDAIATQGPRLRALATVNGVTLRYEAAVASAIPILSVLEHSLAGDEIVEVSGILSGTCNFMLDAMREGQTFSAALTAAQAQGYAEADPCNDIEGVDAAHKLAILIQHAFGKAVVTPRIPRRGITGLTSASVRSAPQNGYEVKLFAHAAKTGDGVVAEVGPVLVPSAHPFARVRGVENAVRLVGQSTGELLFTGAGAGREPSASSVVSDLVFAMRAIAERHVVPRTSHELGLVRPTVEAAFAHFPTFAGLPVVGVRQAQDDTLLAQDDNRELAVTSA
jgi:homoserine dehydrogenase